MNFERRHSGLWTPRIRDRIPPPTKFAARVEGHLHFKLINREGKVVQEGETHNLVLDQGLDYVPTYGFTHNMIAYCAVGTGSTTPATTDTGLVSELARTNTTYSTNATTRTANGVYELTHFFEFTYGSANGNLTEFGFSPLGTAGSNLFSRALFLDGSSLPTTITKTSSEKLHIDYTLTVTLTPTTYTAGSFNITGIGAITGNYMLTHGNTTYNVYADIGVFNQLAKALQLGGGTYNVLYAGGLEALATDESAATYASEYNINYDTNSAHALSANRDAYTPGSFTRTGGLWLFDTGYANITINAFVISGATVPIYYGVGGYVFDLDPGAVFTKDNLHTLTIGAPTVTWSR